MLHMNGKLKSFWTQRTTKSSNYSHRILSWQKARHGRIHISGPNLYIREWKKTSKFMHNYWNNSFMGQKRLLHNIILSTICSLEDKHNAFFWVFLTQFPGFFPVDYGPADTVGSKYAFCKLLPIWKFLLKGEF